VRRRWEVGVRGTHALHVACEGGRAGVELLRDYCRTATGGGVRMKGAWRGLHTYNRRYIHTIWTNKRRSLYNTVSV
jgi:hypothetical protein